MDKKKCLGWREWVILPELGTPHIKAKIDSGAKTSAIHAEDIKIFRNKRTGKRKVKFKLYPKQKSKRTCISAEAELIEKRTVRSSIGAETRRPVIQTLLQIGDEVWPIELTLINRDIMGYRMLIGRQAISHKFLIDPGHSYLIFKKPKKKKKVGTD